MLAIFMRINWRIRMTSSRGELFERLSLIADLECAISHDIESIIFYLSDLRELKLTKSILEE